MRILNRFNLFIAAVLSSAVSFSDTSIIAVNQDDWTDISSSSPTAFITNTSVCDARYVEALVKPSTASKEGHLLHANDQITYSIAPGNNVFVRTINCIGTVTVSPGDTFSTGGGGESSVNIVGPLSSFGEVTIAAPFPIAQITAAYGLLDKTESFLFSGGTTKAENSLFVTSSGTDAAGSAFLLTRRQVAYRAGQGLIARFTSIFDTPVVDNTQVAGLIINTDNLTFGFVGENFGILYQHGGESEIEELTITTPAGGSENATVTVDGTPFTVPLTVGTVQHNAFEIAESLNAQVANYDFTSNDDQVVARSVVFGDNLSFAFSSSTAVAAWVQVEAGLAPTAEFIPQPTWNVDTRISADPEVNLDPLVGNVYQIQMQYLGFGGIEFYVEDAKTAQLVLVHRIKFANTSLTTSVTNPTFRVGWASANAGNTTNIEVKGGSASGFIEGIMLRTESPRAAENTNASVPVGSFVNILTIRNRIAFGTRRNRAEVFGLSLTAATDSVKAAIIEVTVGASITGDLDFQYIDKSNSVVEIADDPGTVTGGKLVASFIVPSSSGVVVNLEELASLILPGEVLTISSQITTGSPSSVSTSIIWQEDL